MGLLWLRLPSTFPWINRFQGVKGNHVKGVPFLIKGIQKWHLHVFCEIVYKRARFIKHCSRSSPPQGSIHIMVELVEEPPFCLKNISLKAENWFEPLFWDYPLCPGLIDLRAWESGIWSSRKSRFSWQSSNFSFPFQLNNIITRVNLDFLGASLSFFQALHYRQWKG